MRLKQASFPFEVPYRLINMYSIKGDTVLDPFGGLSTTTLASIASERNSISVDIDPIFCKDSVGRILNSFKQINKYIANRIESHQSYVNSLPREKKDKCYFNTKMNTLVRTRQETELSINYIKSIAKEEDIIVAE